MDMGVRCRGSPSKWQRPFPEDAPYCLQQTYGQSPVNTWTVSSRQPQMTWQTTTSKSKITVTIIDTP